MTSHEVNLSIFRMVRDMLLHDDGSLKPVGGMDGKVNPQWAYARASNIAQAICGNFVVFPLPGDQASGTIELGLDQKTRADLDAFLHKPSDEPPPVKSRYHFPDRPDPNDDDERIK